jgi:hypothetical protein
LLDGDKVHVLWDSSGGLPVSGGCASFGVPGHQGADNAMCWVKVRRYVNALQPGAPAAGYYEGWVPFSEGRDKDSACGPPALAPDGTSTKQYLQPCADGACLKSTSGTAAGRSLVPVGLDDP